MNIHSQAPGKMILLGEYAVLEGAPALVSSVNRYCQVLLEESSAHHMLLRTTNLDLPPIPFRLSDDGQVLYQDLPLPDARDKLTFFQTCYEELCSTYPEIARLTPMEITIDTSDFFTRTNIKYGLGGSAALTVGLTAALLHKTGLFPEVISRPQFFVRTLTSHRQAQGNKGSGVDIAASTFGGIRLYKPYDPTVDFQLPDSLTWPENLYLLVIWTGKSTNTRDYITLLNKFKYDIPEKYTRNMDQLTSLTLSGCDAFHRQDVPGFLECTELYYHQLDRLGAEAGIPIISKEHQTIHQIVEKCGGVYKSSGAGGGDFGIALAESETLIQKISDSIVKSPFEIIDLSIDQNGVVVQPEREYFGRNHG